MAQNNRNNLSSRFSKTSAQKVAMRSKVRRLILESLEDRRLFNVDWRNPVDSMDVDSDGSVSPLDALVVINTINAGGSGSLEPVRDLAKPYYDVDGDQTVSPLDVLNVINFLNSNNGGVRKLAENASQFVHETNVTITLGQTSGVREYRVQLDSLFDTSDTNAAVEDLLAVYLVDPKNPDVTLLDRGTNGTALFTLAGTRAEFVPGRVNWDGSVLEINLGDLAFHETGLLKFQLINADADRTTNVTIRPLANQVDSQSSLGSKVPIGSNAIAAGAALQMASLAPYTNGTLQFSNVRFEALTGKYNAEVRLRNNGDTVGRNVAVAFPGLPSGVTLSNASGVTVDGSPYVSLKPAIPRGGLPNGAWSEPVSIEFNNPGQSPFSIRPKLFATPNRIPTLAPIAPLFVMPGGVLNVPLNAADPDGDSLQYSIVPKNGTLTIPTGTVDASGALVFRPTPSQLGTYQFDVIASDGELDVAQPVTLSVTADPITTTRVTGKVLKVNGQPLASLPVEIGAVQGLTRADGSFTLDLGTGPVVSDTLKIRGELRSGSVVYPFIAEKLAFILEHDVYAHVNNVIDRPIYLPEIDVAGGTTIDPTRNITVTSSSLPGAKVSVGASTLMNQQGSPFTGVLSLTEVPVDLTPASLPEGLNADLVVTIQPGEMVFSTPTPLSLPNRGGFAPGTVMDLWSINPVTGQFDQVGVGQVNANGLVIDTINGGIRNSSWHFFSPPGPRGPKVEGNPGNKKPSSCSDEADATSSCELHSGALIETHELVTYQSQGVQRGLTLTYDSLRADPRPIVHFTFDELDPNLYSVPSAVRLIAELEVNRDGLSTQVPGYQGGAYGLNGGANIWRLPPEAGSIDAALQVDLRDQPSGTYNYTLRSGMLGYAGARGFIGTLNSTTGQVTSVNTRRSPLGAGWGFDGLLELVENGDGSVLLINGNGNELLYPKNADGSYEHPPGVFAILSKQANGTFRRVWPDQTVEQFGTNKKLSSVTDRNGNVNRNEYDNAGRLIKLIDPVGLETVISYTANRVEISDPASRITRLDLDANGNLIRVTDPDGATRQWRYDSQNHMTGETNALGNVEVANYGFHGRVTDVIRKDGTRRQFFPLDVLGLFPPEQTSADPILNPDVNPIAGRVPVPESMIVDSNGTIVRKSLNQLGQSNAGSDNVGSLSGSIRDTNNLPIVTTSASGSKVFNKYDQLGNLISSQDDLSARLGDEPAIIGLLTGDLQRNGETDRYSFTGKAGEFVWIDKMIGTASIEVLSPSGLTVTDNRLPEDGTYQVNIGNFKGTYKAAIKSLNFSEELDIGNRVSTGYDVGEDLVYRFTAERNQRFAWKDSSASPNGEWRVIGPRNQGVNLTAYPATSEYEFIVPVSGEYYLIYSVAVGSNSPGVLDFTAQLSDPVPISTQGFGIAYTGTLQQGEEKRISFTGAQGAFIYLDNIGQRDQITFELRDPTGRLLPAVDYQAGRVLGDNLFFQLNISGTYEVVFRKSSSGSLGNYHFRIEDLSAARQVSFGSVIRENLQAANGNKSVIYRMSGIEGQRIAVDTSGSDLTLLFLSTVAPYGRNIANNGIFTLPYTGDYFLIFDISDDTSSDFSFSAVDLQKMPLITLGETVPGSLAANAPQQKYYRFSAVPGDTVAFEYLGEYLYPRIQILDEGKLIDIGSFGNLYTLEKKSVLDTQPREYVLSATPPSNVAPTDFGFHLVSRTEASYPISFGQTVAKTIAMNHTDTYKFQGVLGTTIYLDWRRPSTGDRNVMWQLVGPTGTVTPFQLGDDLGPFVLPATGEYQLQISRQTQGVGSYEFQLHLTSAVPLASIGTPVSGNLINGSMLQFFQLNLVAGQRLHFDRSPSNSVLHVISPIGQLVYDSDVPNSEYWVTPETGRYLLRFKNRNDDSHLPLSFEWLISEANDAPVTESGVNTTYQGVAGEAAQVATFVANAGTRILFNGMNAFEGRNAVVLRIVGPDGEAVDDVTWDYFGYAEQPFTLPRSGQYTVIMKGRYNSLTSPINYMFSITSVASIAKIEPGVIRTFSTGLDQFAFRFDVVAGQQYMLQAHVQEDVDTNYAPYRYFSVSASLPVDFSGIATGTPFIASKTATYIGYGRVFYGNLNLSLELTHLNSRPKLPLGTTLAGRNSRSKEDVLRRVEVAEGDKLLIQAESDTWQIYAPQNSAPLPIQWAHVETSPGVFIYEGIISFEKSGTYILQRPGAYDAPLDYSVLLTRLVEPVTPMIGGTLTGRMQTYDPTFSRPTSTTDQQGRKTLYSIDPTNGNVLQVTKVVGSQGGVDDLVSIFTYTASGQIDTITDPIGRITDLDYDALGRLIKRTRAKGLPVQTVETFQYDIVGNLVAAIDENGQQYRYQYDAMNRIKRIEKPDPDGTGPLDAPVTTLTYDFAGNLLRVNDPMGNSSTRSYDAMNRMIAVANLGNAVTTYAYDQSGNVIRTTDAVGNVSRMTYDSRNRMTSSIDAAGNQTQFRYDVNDNLIALVDPAGNLTRYEYDARNRQIAEIDRFGNKTTFAYNSDDQLSETTDRMGRTTKLDYDALGRMSRERWIDANNNIVNVVDYKYDAVDRLVQVQDTVSDIRVTFNELDQAVSAQSGGTADTPVSVLDATYDARGNRLTLTDTINGNIGGKNSYLYDGLNRLVRQSQSSAPNTNNPTADKRVDFAYSGMDLFTSVTRFSDLSGSQIVARTQFTYDSLNRLSNLSHRNAGNQLLNGFTYVYDADSRMTRITDIDGAVDYSYDKRNQLIGANYADPTNRDERYVYDSSGNRVSSILHGENYDIDENNRLISDGTYAFEYDAEGNMVKQTTIASGAVREFSWDHRNRMTRITDRPSANATPSQIAEYVYDAMDRRISKTVSGQTTYFVYDGDDVLVELVDPDQGGPQRPVESMRYLHGPNVDQVFAQEDALGDVEWQLADHLGTVRDLIESDGTVANHLKYDSFGNVISQTSSTALTRYQFTGRELDAETGLQFNRARYYSPAHGRFLSEDPIGFNAQDFNLYRYVGNRPIQERDPSGQNAALGAFGAMVGYTTGFWANVAGQIAAGEDWTNVDLSQAYISGGVGAVAGALGTNKALSTAGALALGGAANMTQYVLTTDQCKWNIVDVAFSFVTGVGGGVIGGTVSRAVPRFNTAPGFINRNGMIQLMPKISDSTRSVFETLNQQADFVLNATFTNLARASAGAAFGAVPSPFKHEDECGCS